MGQRVSEHNDFLNDGELDSKKCHPKESPLRDEKPLFLNPEIDEVEKHLIFLPNGEVRGLSDRGKITIEICNLNNSDKRDDFNCGSSLNVYYRLDNNKWIHKMAYCGQHITETTGWRNSELIFETKNANTIDFLFAYESLSIANNPVLYLIDDLMITGEN